MRETSTPQRDARRTDDADRPRGDANDPCGPTRGGRLHEGAASWCDTCTCEAEPRWRELGEQCGIDPDA